MQKKNKVFGRDLRLHLEDTKQDSKYFEKDHKTEKKKTKKKINIPRLHCLTEESCTDSRNLSISVPPILRVCSKCIEHRGIVDGIYRLSGISSNIRALK